MLKLVFPFAFAFTLSAESRFVRLDIRSRGGSYTVPQVQIGTNEVATLRGFGGHGPYNTAAAPVVIVTPEGFDGPARLDLGEAILGPARVTFGGGDLAQGGELTATLEIQAVNQASAATGLTVTVQGSADLVKWQTVASLHPGGTNGFFKLSVAK